MPRVTFAAKVMEVDGQEVRFAACSGAPKGAPASFWMRLDDDENTPPPGASYLVWLEAESLKHLPELPTGYAMPDKEG